MDSGNPFYMMILKLYILLYLGTLLGDTCEKNLNKLLICLQKAIFFCPEIWELKLWMALPTNVS